MAKQSLLTEYHRRHNAIFVEQDGWLLPDYFGDAGAEYESVRKSAGLLDRSHRALLRFTGPDRVSFLQGMLSNDVRALKVYDGQAATILTQQGKIVADVRVLCAMNSIYLDFWDSLKDKILAHLKRYLVADEVEISDPNDQWKIFSLQGPCGQNILGGLFGRGELPAKLNQHAILQFDNAPVCVVRADHTGFNGFDLVVQNAQLLDLAERLTKLGAVWIGASTENILRVEAGIPLYGVDFSEDNLLLEVGLEHAYSYTKGCYLGQEVVERIRSRGHVNRKLCGLLCDGAIPASANDKILAGDHEVGRITSAVASLALNRPIALAYLHKDICAPGTRLTVSHGDQAIAATVSPLPFVSPPASS